MVRVCILTGKSENTVSNEEKKREREGTRVFHTKAKEMKRMRLSGSSKTHRGPQFKHVNTGGKEEEERKRVRCAIPGSAIYNCVCSVIRLAHSKASSVRFCKWIRVILG